MNVWSKEVIEDVLTGQLCRKMNKTQVVDGVKLSAGDIVYPVRVKRRSKRGMRVQFGKNFEKSGYVKDSDLEKRESRKETAERISRKYRRDYQLTN